jgi:hypothetical protein
MRIVFARRVVRQETRVNEADAACADASAFQPRRALGPGQEPAKFSACFAHDAGRHALQQPHSSGWPTGKEELDNA